MEWEPMKPLLGRLAGLSLGLAAMNDAPAIGSEPGPARPATRAVEFRSYNLKPATRGEFHRLVAEEGLPLLRRFEIDVVAHGPSTHDDTSYYLVRSFADRDERKRQEDAFYASEEWEKRLSGRVMPLVESYTTVVLDLDETTVSGLRSGVAAPSSEVDRRIVAALDTEFQAAVRRNDAQTMARILHEDFVLVTGNGKTFTREDLLQEATRREIAYERQDEDAGTQTVRVWGDTAVVTARLWIKGLRDGVAFDRRLWFSDTYVRTPRGWRYAFGQASLRLPPEAADAKP
jgi:ketosteroid isomerase-like protein